MADIIFSISIDAVAIYAAILSTIVAIFEGVRLWHELTHKVVIKLIPRLQFVVDNVFQPISAPKNLLEVSSVNHSMKDKYLFHFMLLLLLLLSVTKINIK